MINLFNRPSAEAEARAYCRKMGACPDAKVYGKDGMRFGHTNPVLLPRWQWYLGVSEAALRKSIT